jgi:hypothetical protein
MTKILVSEIRQKQVIMNEYEESRRAFLAKLGLAVGTVTLGGQKISARVLNSKTDFPLTAEQQELMNRYEQWMDDFIPVIKSFRANQDDPVAKKQIAGLSEVAESWRPQLTEFMKDENFARYYMTATERMTKEIW